MSPELTKKVYTCNKHFSTKVKLDLTEAHSACVFTGYRSSIYLTNDWLVRGSPEVELLVLSRGSIGDRSLMLRDNLVDLGELKSSVMRLWDSFLRSLLVLELECLCRRWCTLGFSFKSELHKLSKKDFELSDDDGTSRRKSSGNVPNIGGFQFLNPGFFGKVSITSGGGSFGSVFDNERSSKLWLNKGVLCLCGVEVTECDRRGALLNTASWLGIGVVHMLFETASVYEGGESSLLCSLYKGQSSTTYDKQIYQLKTFFLFLNLIFLM